MHPKVFHDSEYGGISCAKCAYEVVYLNWNHVARCSCIAVGRNAMHNHSVLLVPHDSDCIWGWGLRSIIPLTSHHRKAVCLTQRVCWRVISWWWSCIRLWPPQNRHYDGSWSVHSMRASAQSFFCTLSVERDKWSSFNMMIGAAVYRISFLSQANQIPKAVWTHCH